jgi:hypothetical protein
MIIYIFHLKRAVSRLLEKIYENKKSDELSFFLTLLFIGWE